MKPKTNIRNLALLIFTAFFAGDATTHAQESAKPGASQADVLEMRSVPEGHYLVTLELRALDGKAQRLNIEVKGGSAQCINSSDPRLKGLQGKFESIGNGVFMTTLRNQTHTATQFWAFRKDGSAVVKDFPDRGERQTAIPVPDDSIEAPKK
jgi:hypothetical protein